MIRLLLTLSLTAPVSAQIPDEFTNLLVFPKDIERGELIGAMRNFSFGLGVRCEYCHEGGPSLDSIDFASDAKEAKKTARRMLTMVRTINDDHLSSIDRPDRLTVQCATCHHGVSRPESLESILRRELDASGLEGAMKRYRELRADYYGSFSYDFSDGPLNRVGESLMRSGQVELAIDVLELNAEYHESSAWLMGLLGEAHLANGDRDAARRSFERVLEINPDSSSASKALESLREN